MQWHCWYYPAANYERLRGLLYVGFFLCERQDLDKTFELFKACMGNEITIWYLYLYPLQTYYLYLEHYVILISFGIAFKISFNSLNQYNVWQPSKTCEQSNIGDFVQPNGYIISWFQIICNGNAEVLTIFWLYFTHIIEPIALRLSVGLLDPSYCHNQGWLTMVRLPTSIGNSVRFNWPHLTGESRQFIHTVGP